MSNCGTSYDPFGFESWTITKQSPGEPNLCIGGVDHAQIPDCEIQASPDETISVQVNEEFSCAQKVIDTTTSLHEAQLHSVHSRELEVTGMDDKVTGLYVLTEVMQSERPVYIKETNSRFSNTDSYFIFYASLLVI